MKPQRVLALVHKGLEPPDEKVDKSTAQAAEWRMEYDVVRTLKVLGHEVRVIGVHDDLTPIRTTMDDFKPTITFNLMEAFDDVVVFDQNVVSYLELLKVPYTGCNPRGLTLSRDKALAKKLMAYHRIPVPDFLVVPLGGKAKLPKRLQYPLIVKSLTYESSTGISQASVVENDEQLAKRVQFIHDTIMTPAIVEEFIDGRELYCGVIGNDRLQTFPVWEMSFSKMPENNWKIATERVKWSVKYQKKHGIDTALAGLTDEESGKVQHLAKRVYRALDLSGYARIDLRMKPDGQLSVIEANPNPQLAQGEDFAESAQRADVSYAKLIEKHHQPRAAVAAEPDGLEQERRRQFRPDDSWTHSMTFASPTSFAVGARLRDRRRRDTRARHRRQHRDLQRRLCGAVEADADPRSRQPGRGLGRRHHAGDAGDRAVLSRHPGSRSRLAIAERNRLVRRRALGRSARQ